MKFGLLTVLFLFYGIVCKGQTYTLKQCIDTALKNNILVRQTGLQSEAAQVRYQQAKSNLLPDINGSISYGINQGRSIDPFTNNFVNQNISYSNYGLGVNIPLFNGLTLRNEIKQFSFAFKAESLEADQVKTDITLNVIIAYLQVLNNEDLLKVSQQQVEVSKKQIERLEVLNKQGAISPPQLHELNGQLKDNELNVLNNQIALNTAKLALSQLMNVPFSEDIRLQRFEESSLAEAPELRAEEIYEKALNQLAGAKAVEYWKKSAEASVKASRGALFPSLSFNGGASTNYSSIAARDVFLNTTEVTTSNYVVVNGTPLPVVAQRNNFKTEKVAFGSQIKDNYYTNFGLTLRVPILNSFQVRNRIKLAKIELRNSELLEESWKVQLRQQVEQAHLNLVNAWKRHQLILEQVASFREAFRAAEIRFNAGLGTSIDFILAKNNYDRAALSLVMVQYDYLLRKQVMNYLTGTNP